MSQIVENKLQVGDLVRVIDADSLLHGLEGRIAQTDFGAGEDPKRDDGKYSASYFVETKSGMGWFTAKCLEPAEPGTDHIADADKMVGAPHRDGLVLRSEWNAEEGCFEESRVELEKESQYRTPHPGDVGKRIEVSDSEDPTSDDSVWRERTLVAVLAFPGTRPHGNFVTAVEGRDAKNICHTWKHARIKVEQPAIDEPTPESQGHPDHVEGVWVEEVINATSINFKPKRPVVVYIAGPMRGIPHFNFPAFDAAKAYLMEKGYDVLSPADFDRELDGFDPYKAEYETAEGCAEFPGDMDFKRVVTRDLTAVTQCDAVALLSGWEKSKGAVAEIAVAHWMGKPVMHLLCDAHRSNEVVYIVNNDSTTLEQFVLQLAHAHDAYDKRINCAIDTPPLEQDPDCDILEVAASITRGDRQAVYGPPDQDFKKTADMWTGMFQYMLASGAKFEPRHVAMAMICIKLSREFHQRKRDNWIDIAGYARCGSLCSS